MLCVSAWGAVRFGGVSCVCVSPLACRGHRFMYGHGLCEMVLLTSLPFCATALKVVCLSYHLPWRCFESSVVLLLFFASEASVAMYNCKVQLVIIITKFTTHWERRNTSKTPTACTPCGQRLSAPPRGSAHIISPASRHLVCERAERFWSFFFFFFHPLLPFSIIFYNFPFLSVLLCPPCVHSASSLRHPYSCPRSLNVLLMRVEWG